MQKYQRVGHVFMLDISQLLHGNIDISIGFLIDFDVDTVFSVEPNDH